MSPVMSIGGRMVGPDHPPFVIAEMSANHLGQRERAHALIDAAADAGCDAMKLQTFTPAAMTIDSAEGHFTIAGMIIPPTISSRQRFQMKPWL